MTPNGAGFPPGTARTYQGVPSAPDEKPRLQRQVDLIEKVLHACHAATANIESAVERMTGPTPIPSAREDKSIVPPAVPSFENRLLECSTQIERLLNRLEELAQKINSAV